jgi:hypothetical protein
LGKEIMNTHHVVLFLNVAEKQFSVTARKSSDARLNEVIKAESQKGFIDITIARNQTKEAASQRAKELAEEWENRGFEQVSRERLS